MSELNVKATCERVYRVGEITSLQLFVLMAKLEEPN
jgi:hypothetical protein